MTADQQGITDPTTGQFIQGGVPRVIGDQTYYGTDSNGIFIADTGKLAQVDATKAVFPGYFQQNPDGTQSFIATMTLGDQTVSGTIDSAGNFYVQSGPQAGLEEIPAGGGPPVYGVTDPTTGFIKGGVTRVIGDQTYYGTDSNGIFIDDTGTLAQVDATKAVFPGYFQQNPDGTQSFVATFDGQTGTIDSAGDFYVQSGPEDGKEEIPAGGGPPVYGVTDPVTGQFIPGGVPRVIGDQTYYGTDSNGIFIDDTGTLAQVDATKAVFPGYFQQNPDGTQSFIATLNYHGQTLSGTIDSAGDFYVQSGPQAGLEEIPAGGGPPVYGITDPGTGFIPGGVIRVIDGQTYYGTVDQGIFFADTGTLAQVLSTGQVFAGHTQQNPDGTQSFIATLNYHGQTLSGTIDKNGNFYVQSGPQAGLEEIPAGGGPPVYGVTDPATGDFIPGGVAKTMPDGTILYGYMEGNDFITSDDTKIVFANGTVVTGTYDPSTGIFTAANGSFYFVGTNGIVSATKQSDGSYKLPDGSIVMTPQAWKVDLPVFLDAIGFVETYSFLIALATAEIQAQYSAIESAWSSPGGSSFHGIAAAVNTGIDYLNTMLTDIVQRMQTSYQNYLNTENTNAQNVSARSG